jgi:hypothetical protein
VKRSKIYFFLAILTALFLQGCAMAPEYDTFHSYVPPKGAEAKSCLFQCTMTETQCEQISQMRLDNCTMRSQSKYDACQAREQRTYDNCVHSGRTDCYVGWCPQDECSTASNCKTKFNSCYSICGGVVTSETRCVANCEQPK